MEVRKEKPIYYEQLKTDWILVNLVMGIVFFIMFIYMVLQKVDVLPNSTCLFHDMFRMYCPGCGGTRALFTLLQGKILHSLYCNPAVLLGLILVLYYEIGIAVTLKKRNGKRYYTKKLWPPVLYVVIVLVFCVVRNYLLLAHGFDMLNDFL